MLSDEQIQEEALKRIEAMNPVERGNIEAEIRNGFLLVDEVVAHGEKSLSKEERRLYYLFERKNLLNQSGGGFEYAEIEATIKASLKCSREDIAAMKKNPYMTSFFRTLIIMAIVVIGGTLLTALIGKLSGMDMGGVYVGISAASGAFALRCGDLLIKAGRFRKLQKAYEKPDFQESEIQAVVWRILRDKVKAQRYN